MASQDSLPLNFLPFQVIEDVITERVAPFTPEFKLPFIRDEHEALVLTLGSGVKQLFCYLSAKFHKTMPGLIVYRRVRSCRKRF
jgi:hypothetical protein